MEEPQSEQPGKEAPFCLRPSAGTWLGPRPEIGTSTPETPAAGRLPAEEESSPELSSQTLPIEVPEKSAPAEVLDGLLAPPEAPMGEAPPELPEKEAPPEEEPIGDVPPQATEESVPPKALDGEAAVRDGHQGGATVGAAGWYSGASWHSKTGGVLRPTLLGRHLAWPVAEGQGHDPGGTYS